jgi:ATP-binding cassette, subfamily B, multidrug efflux pump
MNGFRELYPYFGRHRRALAAGAFCSFASALTGLLVPMLVGRAVDDLGAGVTAGKLASYALTITGVSAVSGAFLFLHRSLLLGFSRNVEHDLRLDLYIHLQRMPTSFFEAQRTGALMARLISDLTAVRHIAGMVTMYTLQAVFVVALVFPYMIRISLPLTLMLLSMMLLVTLTAQGLGGKIHTRYGQIQELFAQVSARVQENITGVRLIRAYAREPAEVTAFKRLNRDYTDGNLGLIRVSAVMRPLIQFLIGIISMLIVWYGGTLAARREITVGQLTEFSLYLARLIWPMIAMGNAVNLYQRGTASMERLMFILAAEPAIADRPGVREQPPLRGRIEFRSLTFAYDEGRAPVLRDINLTVEAGQTVAFVGRTGAGKSTLVNLIPRLADAPPDTVFIDGVSVREYPLQQLRAAIGHVPQETFLFSETLGENVAFSVGRAERAAVERAVEVAGLSEDVRHLPDGLDTLVGERGVTLSGGQKQRAAIARAVLRRPRILILDDALSAVDTYTEGEILARLRGVRHDCTSLIVSHRISAVSDADLICVLDGGRIVERGTHDELLALGGQYADLYERQQLEDALTTG